MNDSTGAVLFEETTLPPSLFALVPDLAAETEMGPAPFLRFWCSHAARRRRSASDSSSSSSGSSSRSVKLDKLISQGAELFFEETFNGNGRTCGTCHPASNNFTDRSGLHHHAAGQRSAVRGGVQPGAGAARTSAR